MLPIYIILTLVCVGFIATFSKNKVIAKSVALIGLAVASMLMIVMASKVQAGDTISFVIGTPPWNLSLSIGPLEVFMGLIFSIIGFFIVWASITMIEHDVKDDKIPLYYGLICWLTATLCSVVFFDNLFNVFLFIELSSFAAAGIVIIKNQPENLRAGLKYLLLSILGSGLVLMGIVIFFSLTGQLGMDLIHDGLGSAFLQNKQAVLVALVFITVGVSFKSALFPFHIWLPDAHGTAPSPSSAVLSSLVLKGYIMFYIKILYRVVGFDILQDPVIVPVLRAVLFVGVTAMICGSILAILQTDIKRMIAYSSVAQIGYIFMGIGLGTKLGLFAAIFHILAHAVTKSGLFLQAGSIIEQTHNRDVSKMGGLGYKMPITMTMFTIGALSMIGIPMFAGFNSKWNFAVAIMGSGSYWVMIVLAVSSLLNALYYLPIVVRSFFGQDSVVAKNGLKTHSNIERPLKDILPIMILSALVILVVIFSAPIANMINAGIGNFN